MGSAGYGTPYYFFTFEPNIRSLIGFGTAFEPGRCRMKGYNTQNGYMGFVGDRYMLFANESEYLDYMRSVNE